MQTKVFPFNLTDRCEGVSCKPWEKCVYDSSNGVSCVCRGNLECPADFQPICGSDADRYNNYCIMKATACRQGKKMEKVADGSCTPGMHIFVAAAVVVVFFLFVCLSVFLSNCLSFCLFVCLLFCFFCLVVLCCPSPITRVFWFCIGFSSVFSVVLLSSTDVSNYHLHLCTGAICQIVPSSNCRGYFRNFYFNLETNACEPIIAGGCHPSGWNGFTAMEDCNRTCSGNLKP